MAEGAEITDEGVEEAFEVVADVPEGSVPISNVVFLQLTILYSVKTAKWIGDCFIYTTNTNRLSYFVGNESYSISPFDT